jgi:hypothetical protein
MPPSRRQENCEDEPAAMNVDGRVCAAHDPASAGYFAWHWQNTFRDAKVTRHI